jgi:ATP-binding cassette subfamily B protein
MNMFAGLDGEAYDRKYSDRQLLQRIGRFLGVYRLKIAASFAALMLMAVMSTGFPLLIAAALDRLPVPPVQLAQLAAASLSIGVLMWGLNYWRARWFSELIGDVVLALRSEAFRAAAEHDLSFYDEFRSGRVISRITSDTQDFAQGLQLLGDILDDIAAVLVLLVVLMRLEWRLTLLVVALTPFVFWMASAWRHLARGFTQRASRAIANVNAAIQEAVTGISVAKNFRQEATIYSQFTEVNRASYDINWQRGFLLATVFPALNAMVGCGSALLIYAGGRAAGAGIITAGTWFLFLAAVERFWFPVSQLAAFWSQFQGGLAAAERVFALIDAEPAVRQTGAQQLKLQGTLEFSDVHFRYSRQEAVLRGFSLRIEPGESVALVGHTGAGKSSVIKLLARFYDFQSGSLRIDGHDVRSLELRSLRSQLGLVPQMPFLFAGSVADNIRYACPQATDAQLLLIARQIGAGEWLGALPNGLDSEVGERGSRLSLGQRQLVALARVLVQRPPVFILDEATASIDPFTEAQIQEALELILKRCTSIMIAHRLSTVRSASRIIVMAHGEIIEHGSHTQLLSDGGHYAEIYQTYFRHQSPDYTVPQSTPAAVIIE